jgi:hypothetical protein
MAYGAQTAESLFAAMAVTKQGTSAARLRALAIKAAKYAKDPGSNPALTAREISEFLTRLALAEAADDQ